MIISKEEAEKIIREDSHDWEKLYDTERFITHGRWTLTYEAVFIHKNTGKHYLMSWNVPATEMQDCDAFYGNEVELTEVQLKEVMVKQWVPV